MTLDQVPLSVLVFFFVLVCIYAGYKLTRD